MPGKTRNAHQLEVIKAIRGCEVGKPHNYTIQAAAGAGKTDTAAEAVKGFKDSSKVRAMAFNVAIVDDLKDALKSTQAKVGTIHGYFMGTTGRFYVTRLNAKYRMSNKDVAEKLALADLELPSKRVLTPVQQTRMVKQGVMQFAKSDAKRITGWHIPYQEGLDGPDMKALRDHLGHATDLYWRDIVDNSGEFPFDPMYYIKIGTLNENLRVAGKCIIVDEAQDVFENVMSWLNRQFHISVVMTGDSAQSINEWAGAKDALANLRAATKLTMPQSYRFSQAIADLANVVLPFTGAEMEVIGNPDKITPVGPMSNPTAILCRKNVDVIAAALAELEAGRSVAMPKNQTQEIKDLATAAQQLQAGVPCDHPEFAAFTNWQDVREYAEHDRSELKVTVDLIDKHGPDSLLKLVDSVRPMDQADVLVSTAHRTKGLTLKRVAIRGEWPNPYESGRDLSEADAKLMYVAMTRASEALDPTALEPALDWCADNNPADEDGSEAESDDDD